MTTPMLASAPVPRRILFALTVFALVIAYPRWARAEQSAPESAPASQQDPPAENAPVVASEIAPPETDRVKPEDDDDSRTRFGPLVGLGFPRPIAFEALLKLNKHVAIGAEYSLLPKLTVAGAETTFWAVSGDARVFPFGGTFFLGLRGGFQRLHATTNLTVAQLGTLIESATAEASFINPRIGFLWTASSGLTAGMEVGVQIPLHSTITSTLPAAVAARTNDSLASVADVFGNGVTPTVDLLRIGLLF